MTDKELIALIETKLPQELSFEEIGEVRERLRKSSLVRQTLVGRLQLDQYLCATVGHVELSADAIFAAGRANRFRRASLWSWFGWGVCVLLVGFVVSMLVWPLVRGPVANNDGPPNVARSGKGPVDPNAADALAGAKTPDGGNGVTKGGTKGSAGGTTARDPKNGVGGNPKGPDDAANPDAPGNPAGGAKLNLGRIDIDATVPSKSEQVEVDRTNFGRGIGGVIVSVGVGSFVEYDFAVKDAGAYQLELKYATDQQRPMQLVIDGEPVNGDVAIEATPSSAPKDQRSFQVAVIRLKAGKHKLRLVPRIGLPNLSRLILTQVADEASPAAKGPPWDAKDQLAGAPRPFEQIALETFDRPDDFPTPADLLKWFTPQSGGQIEQQSDPSGMRPLAIDGLQRFNGPWKDDAVLRLSLDECQQGFGIHFWKGQVGTMLRLYSNQKWALVAYATRRNGAEPVAQSLVTTASDDARNWQTGSGRLPMRFDVRFRGGELIVSRGDVVLLRAPFDGLPSETYFDGHCRVRGLAMVRTADDLPGESELLPIAADIDRPTTLSWEGKTIPGVEFKRLDDGSVQLKSQGAQDFGWHWFDLPKTGFYEVTLELDDLTPGARISFGPPRTEPRWAVGFFVDGQAHGMPCRLLPAGDRTDRHDPHPEIQPSAYAARHQWLRLIGSCGLVKCYGSADGIHWARFAGQENQLFSAPIGRIGLGCTPSREPASIRLRRVTLREFGRLSKLAPAEMVAKAPLVPAASFSDWLADVGRRQPRDVAPDVWRRACALRSLSSYASAGLGRELLAALFDDSLGQPVPVEERLRLLDEVALWTNVWQDAAAANALAGQYERLGAELARETRPAWATLTAAVGRAPIWCEQVNSVAMDGLFRTDLIRQIYAGNAEQVRLNLAWLRLLNGTDPRNSSRGEQAVAPLIQWTLDWLAAWRPVGAKAGDGISETVEADDPADGARQPAPAIDAAGGPVIRPFQHRLRRRPVAIDQNPAGGRVERRHPLIVDSNKEGFSMLAEFESALDGKEYRDACKTITSGAAFDVQGLFPDSRDPELLISFDLAVDTAMRRDAVLRETMIRQFGPLGMLQVRRAMNEQDAAAVASTTIRYRGTEAAAEALIWLGDRALSGGDFHGARTYYRQALHDARPTIAERVAPRDRMAAAMLGVNAGHPATGAVTLGDVQMGAGEFESMVAEMRKVHASGTTESSGASDDWNAAPVAPAPGGFDVREMARFDGDMGSNPANVGATLPARGNSVLWQTNRAGSSAWSAQFQTRETMRELDWVARQLAAAHDNARLYVNNRFQLIAYDLKTGSRQWQTPPAGQARDQNLQTHDWTLMPMRPLPVDRHLFVRRLTTAGPELASLDKEKGNVEWRTQHGLLVVSDPLWVGGELLAITAALDEPQPMGAIDPRIRGRMIFIGPRQVVNVPPPVPNGFPQVPDRRNLSWKQTAFNLTAFDPESGQVRRQQRIATMNEGWGQQRTCQLSLVAEDHLVVVLGGAVICCDLSGKSLWARRQEWLPPAVDPDWGRQYQAPPLVDGERLFVTQPGVLAVECLDLRSGSLIWRAPMPGIHRLTGLIGDRLIVETDDGLTALSSVRGDVVWRHEAGDLLEGQLCGSSGRLVYSRREQIPEARGKLRPVLIWLNPNDGRQTARAALDSLQAEMPMFGPFVAAGDRLWVFAAGKAMEPTRTIYELVPHGAVSMRGETARRIATTK